ncbi:MAG: DUF4476 domain-containing protein [Sphingobacteriia bacterium]|nr:DUF4476 domain-containing protein [Sphingobacteriia bacterium]
MIKWIILIFVWTFGISTFSLPIKGKAQGSCNQPLAEVQFNQEKNNLRQRLGASALLAGAMQLSERQCLTSQQIKEIAQLFGDDYDRLTYAKKAWLTVYDRTEFFAVMDAFVQASMMFKLYEYIRQPFPQTTPNPLPPAIIYPDASVYTGNKGCQMYLDNVSFQKILSGVEQQSSEQAKMNYLASNLAGQCYSVAQIMQLSMSFKVESSRLNFLKPAAVYVYDIGNLYLARQVFQQENNRGDWQRWLSESGPKGITTPTPPACSVSNEQMVRIVNSLNQQSVMSSRTSLARQQIIQYKCFKAEQIRSIVKTISVESYRLEVMKMAYAYTLDRQEFLNILDALSVQSSRDEIIRMVAENP